MTRPLYAVYGVSGCGRGVMPLARQQLAQTGVPPDQLVFVDDNPPDTVVNGHRVLTYQAFLNEKVDVRFAVLAIANSRMREKLAERCEKDGVQAWSVAAANAIIMDDVEIGVGSILSPFVTFTSNIRVGRFFHANLYSYVEHDSVIGDFVTFAPGVKCNGNVLIEDHAYIGAGAVLRQGQPGKPLVIGKGAIVGMGAIVTKDVPPGVTVAGNPAKPMA